MNRGGFESVLEMLVLMPEAEQEKLLTNLAKEDPKLVERLRTHLLRFEDLEHADDAGLQLLFREAGPTKWALALKLASEELIQKLMKNLSERAKEGFLEEVESLGPRRKTDVLHAQSEICEVAKKLRGEGKLVLKKDAESDPIIE